jgi:hypothetical protein
VKSSVTSSSTLLATFRKLKVTRYAVALQYTLATRRYFRRFRFTCFFSIALVDHPISFHRQAHSKRNQARCQFAFPLLLHCSCCARSLHLLLPAHPVLTGKCFSCSWVMGLAHPVPRQMHFHPVNLHVA